MTQQLRPAPTSDHSLSRKQRWLMLTCLHDSQTAKYDGDDIIISCLTCGRIEPIIYAHITPHDEIETSPAFKAKAAELAKEPRLTQELERYCDLRRRGHDDQEIGKITVWSAKINACPEQYCNLLLEEAIRRGMKGTDDNRDVDFREWLLEMHNLGIGIRHICRLSGRSQTETREALEIAQYAELECWTTLQENYAEAAADADWP